MNDERLGIYLDDHLALMVGEIELAGRSQSNNSDRPLAAKLARIKSEVEEQKSSAEEVLKSMNGSSSKLKKGSVWLAEKAARFKLNDSLVSYSELSRVDELEGLISGAQERILLWETLDALAETDPRLKKAPHRLHLEEAQNHLSELRDERRQAAAEAFA